MYLDIIRRERIEKIEWLLENTCYQHDDLCYMSDIALNRTYDREFEEMKSVKEENKMIKNGGYTKINFENEEKLNEELKNGIDVKFCKQEIERDVNNIHNLFDELPLKYDGMERDVTFTTEDLDYNTLVYDVSYTVRLGDTVQVGETTEEYNLNITIDSIALAKVAS